MSIAISGVEVKLARGEQTKLERHLDLQGKTITAIGTLKLKSPESKISGFELEEATITISSTRLKHLQRLLVALHRSAATFRRRFEQNLVSSYSVQEAALATGMLLGSKEQFSNHFFHELQQSGLLHLVAASGYNISIMIGAAGGLVVLLLKNPFVNLIAVIFFISFYIIIAGAEASVVRAGIMGSLGFLALQAGSTSSAKRIFILVVLLMLLVKPSWLWNLGFQLSAAATTGLLWIDPLLKAKMLGLKENHPRRVKKSGLIEEFTASISASLTTLPVLITRLGWERISLAGVLVNIPAGMLVAPVMAIGAGVGLFGFIWPAGAQVLGLLGRPALWGMIKLIELGAWLNGIIV